MFGLILNCIYSISPEKDYLILEKTFSFTSKEVISYTQESYSPLKSSFIPPRDPIRLLAS